MNLYLITRPDAAGYDEYDGAVVRAESPDAARRLHPNGWVTAGHPDKDYKDSWVVPDQVIVEILAENVAGEAGIILASYNAG